jgi:hypothetical protein
MAMKKSIGRTLAHIDVAANTSVRIHEDFFNTHGYSRRPSVSTSFLDYAERLKQAQTSKKVE